MDGTIYSRHQDLVRSITSEAVLRLVHQDVQAMDGIRIASMVGVGLVKEDMVEVVDTEAGVDTEVEVDTEEVEVEDMEVDRHPATAAMDTDLPKDLPKARATTQLIHLKDTVVHLHLNRVTEDLLVKVMVMASRLRRLKVIIKKVVTVKVPLKGMEKEDMAARNIIAVTTIVRIDQDGHYMLFPPPSKHCIITTSPVADA